MRVRDEPAYNTSRHTIRLRGPWECELYTSPDAISRDGVGASPGDTAEVLTIKLPVDWCEFLHRWSFGSMVWRRRFGLPTGISDGERVDLVISDLHEDVTVWLNEVRIESVVRNDVNTRFNVTNRLQVRNRIALAIQGPLLNGRTSQQPLASSGELTTCPFGDVYLEILTAC